MKIIWEHVSISIPGIGVHIFHCVVRELRWIKRIGGIQANEGQKMWHESGIYLILVAAGGGAYVLDADESW